MNMQQELLASTYFSLEDFALSSLWKKEDFAWEALLLLEKYFQKISLGKIEASLSPSVHLENPSLISIGKGSIIEPGVFIQGPCFIGQGCTIRAGAYLRENVWIGDHCVVGHGSEVKHSLFFPHAHAAHFAYVGNSILGKNVNLGAGVKCANYRLDGKEIVISLEGKKIRTGTNKLGAIIGDGAQIGCNCVLNPATFVGKNTHCHPLLTLKGILPADALVKKEDSLQVSSKKKVF
jgi:UDP-N-acetylglucosamine diphosphorylase / glucose-1-phosphate thymidylyltransferase / UDP-N-acetylgalactosamine diphosphorylase / glucosamine-1-phosphate N-acetyltransferase / galactosamine-1-phosphate N-acetyltransferase